MTCDSIQLFHTFAATVKSIARGAVDDPTHYHTRPQPKAIDGANTAPRAIELTVVFIRHKIVVLLPNQCKVKFT